ncbi:hypothetical protein TEA_005413 [Camellia sinensis var. sinensis]|uniref:non-specific serine/threonine protein kinase n=1 Tax=Camellia sinensis var. sinensis TaxID=542762 RepID=A0A4V3WK82_CAMSN|nr:hypothetical protein TEA_005413 [Camellia sinensis var. sinensis]
MASIGGGGGDGERVRTRVGRYELGRTLGEGAFAKVKFGRNLETDENVAIKILNKEKILKHDMIGQSSKGRLKEDEARKYFQQLINAVNYCHSRGVFHRDLKPENLLLDANGILKVSDFGLSALPQQVREDGLLHTTCGTPNYVAPEVIKNKGYDGAKADLWSCGVILFVLLAGFLPFEESNLMELYKKDEMDILLRGDQRWHEIFKAEFLCPPWFSSGSRKLIKRILDPNTETVRPLVSGSCDKNARITIAEIIENEWFQKGYRPPTFEQEDVSLDDVDAIFDESGDSKNLVVVRREEQSATPVTMNAFEFISRAQGLNLSSLFEKHMGVVKRETRFTSKCPANEIISKFEEAAASLGFDVRKKNCKLKLQAKKIGYKGHLSIATEVLEVAPSLYMVELRKTAGDTLEFHKFYKSLSTGLKDIVWKTCDETEGEVNEGLSDDWNIFIMAYLLPVGVTCLLHISLHVLVLRRLLDYWLPSKIYVGGNFNIISIARYSNSGD